MKESHDSRDLDTSRIAVKKSCCWGGGSSLTQTANRFDRSIASLVATIRHLVLIHGVSKHVFLIVKEECVCLILEIDGLLAAEIGRSSPIARVIKV